MLFRKITEPFEKVDIGSKKIENYCGAILEILREEQKALNSFNQAIEVVDRSGVDIEDQKEIYKKSTTNKLIEEFKKSYK